jgi:hypothetical protein
MHKAGNPAHADIDSKTMKEKTKHKANLGYQINCALVRFRYSFENAKPIIFCLVAVLHIRLLVSLIQHLDSTQHSLWRIENMIQQFYTKAFPAQG